MKTLFIFLLLCSTVQVCSTVQAADYFVRPDGSKYCDGTEDHSITPDHKCSFKSISQLPPILLEDSFNIKTDECPLGYKISCSEKPKKIMYVPYETFKIDPDKYKKFLFYKDIVIVDHSGNFILKRQ